MADVGLEKVFENDKVIVWNFELAPGEETPVHTHEHSYMWYAISGAPLQVTDENEKGLGHNGGTDGRNLFAESGGWRNRGCIRAGQGDARPGTS